MPPVPLFGLHIFHPDTKLTWSSSIRTHTSATQVRSSGSQVYVGNRNHRAEPVSVLRRAPMNPSSDVFPRTPISWQGASFYRPDASPDWRWGQRYGVATESLGKTKPHATRRGVSVLTQIPPRRARFFAPTCSHLHGWAAPTTCWLKSSLRPSSGRRARRRDPGKAKDSTFSGPSSYPRESQTSTLSVRALTAELEGETSGRLRRAVIGDRLRNLSRKYSNIHSLGSWFSRC